MLQEFIHFTDIVAIQRHFTIFFSPGDWSFSRPTSQPLLVLSAHFFNLSGRQKLRSHKVLNIIAKSLLVIYPWIELILLTALGRVWPSY